MIICTPEFKATLHSQLVSGVITQKTQPAPDFPNQEPEIEFNIMTAFATAHQKYLPIITVF